jgi:7-carboxy-7-deazaguanine synthase
LFIQLAILNGAPEIFYSIQGEGRSLGIPSIFVRTSLCNLHCVWCDTDYTWNWIGTPFEHAHDNQQGYQKFEKKDWLKKVALEEVVTQITKFPCKRIIWTGGEPMMQQKALIVLMQLLRSIDTTYFFEVETNGTYVPLPDFDALINQYNVSPKLENSGNPVRLREKPRTMQFFASNAKAGFKYVVANDSDTSEVLSLIKKYHLAANRVWLMPQADNRTSLETQRLAVVETCLEHGFNYSDRLHVQIWDSKKGV